MVYSSTTLSGVASKIDGVIHGSRTNHPPRFTPRIFSPPETQPEPPRLKGFMRPVGAPSASEESSAAAARMVVETLENAIVHEKSLIWSQMSRPFKDSKWKRWTRLYRVVQQIRNANTLEKDDPPSYTPHTLQTFLLSVIVLHCRSRTIAC